MAGVLGLCGKVELMVIHDEAKNNYEHNVVVMNLPMCPKTADNVFLNNKDQETRGCIFLE